MEAVAAYWKAPQRPLGVLDLSCSPRFRSNNVEVFGPLNE